MGNSLEKSSHRRLRIRVGVTGAVAGFGISTVQSSRLQ